MRSFYNILQMAVIDEKNHQTITTNDGFGRHIRTDQYEGEYTSPDWTTESYFHADYDYDVLDNLRFVTDRGGKQTEMQYDALSRKTYLSDPNMGTWYYDYDAVGNLIKQVDAGEQRICFYYDELDRLKGKSYFTGFADCPADQGYDEYLTTYYYDGAYPSDDGAPQPQGQVIGKRTAMGWGVNDWTVYHYADIRGRLNQEQTRIDGQTYSTGYSYDAMDRMTGMTYPNAGTEPVAYTYNDQGLLDSVVGNQPYVAGSIYDEAGRLISRVQQNNANEWVTTYTYHLWNDNPNLGRLSTITASGTSDTGSAEYQNLRYSYDRVGNVEMIEDLKVNQTQSFDYDYLDRLTSASASVGDGNGVYEEAYQYYRGGSLQHKGDPVNTSDGLYDYLDDNHSHAVTGYRGNTYAYDANGNMTSRTVDGVSYSLDYDMENRLIGVSGGGPTVTFTYDGDGNRVKKDEGGVVTHYPGRHYEATIGSGSTKYYYANGQLEAFERSADYDPEPWGLRYVFRDHLGSTSAIVNGKGEKLWEDRFLPFGDVRYTYRKDDDSSFPVQTGYRYTSQWFEDGLGASEENGLDRGLYYYGARWLDPSIARFLQPDTIVPEPGNPQSLNRYSYGSNNPVKFTDPTGHCVVGYSGDVRMNEYPYGTSGICANTEHWIDEGNAGIGQTYADYERYELDAVGLGGSVSGSIETPLVSARGVVAVEVIADPQTGIITLFVAPGYGGSLGMNANFIEWAKKQIQSGKYNPVNAGGTVYLLAIENVDNPAQEYSGQSIQNTVTAAYGGGVTAGHAFTPRDVIPGEPTGARASVFGLTAGYGLTVDASDSFYIPIVSLDGSGPDRVQFHSPNEYGSDFVQWLKSGATQFRP